MSALRLPSGSSCEPSNKEERDAILRLFSKHGYRILGIDEPFEKFPFLFIPSDGTLSPSFPKELVACVSCPWDTLRYRMTPRAFVSALTMDVMEEIMNYDKP